MTSSSRAAAAAAPTRDQIRALYELPFPELVYRAATVHRAHHDPLAIQQCTLNSIKTGKCSEDCAYCPQSAHHETKLESHGLKSVDEVREAARAARDAGSTRFCLGAAWRSPRNGREFDEVLDMVRAIRDLGMEACVTLGMLTADQAARLAEAGLTAYNHNIDTSPEYYPEIITTRKFEDRLQTIDHVHAAGISLCCGGIVGMGESREDRIGFLHALAAMSPPPESVPINSLVAVEGTPLENAAAIDPLEVVRTIATARLLMPTSRVRLSAGRLQMTDEMQALCFLAGANSIFAGDKLLTTPNPGGDRDGALFERLGVHPESAAEAQREREIAGVK